MKTLKTSWLFTDIGREGLFSELVKIGAPSDPKKPGAAEVAKKPGWWKDVARTMAVSALGTGVGMGIGELVARKVPLFTQPTPGRAALVKILLPIMGGSAAILTDRYRKSINEQYKKVPGWKSDK
jgi:hypothetical protein